MGQLSGLQGSGEMGQTRGWASGVRGKMDIQAERTGTGQAETPREGSWGGQRGRGEGEVAFVKEGELSQSSLLGGREREGENPKKR